MIGYIQGTLLKKETDRILLLAGQVGYEILLPPMVMESISDKTVNDSLSFFIYYHQTERQPKPVLIGFNDETEKEFFQIFITVEDIGPLKALKALTMPVGEIARAIETKDTAQLHKLKGIGNRTAQKIIASLQGKLDRFTLPVAVPQDVLTSLRPSNIVEPVLAVLVEQLGHRPADAKKMIADAFGRNNGIFTPEALFDEIYRGEKSS
ncbi:MAG: Holliday junction branch migration protein RuvA [Pseudomonadota bacterium]